VPDLSPEIVLALTAYNEETALEDVIARSIAFLEQWGRSWEILVIDNHSTDATPEIARRFADREPRVRLIRHEENRLFSGSCATALREAKGRYLAIMDTDGQCVATDLPGFLEKIEAGVNFVTGWRRKRHDPFMRLVISSVFNALARFWFGNPLHDLNCGFRVMDRNFIEQAEIRHRVNMAGPELVVRAMLAGLKIDEVEIEHHPRSGGRNCHDFSRLLDLFLQTNRYFRDLGRELKESRRERAKESS